MALLVRFPDGHTLRFRSSFHIGRERGCDVEVADAHVSRRHAEVSLVNGTWVIRDLQSSNGLFVNGRQVDTAPIGDSAEVTLGADGPTRESSQKRLRRRRRLLVSPEKTSRLIHTRSATSDRPTRTTKMHRWAAGR